jgi:hypothetical protein
MIEIADGTNKEQNEKGYLENERRGQKVESERITKTKKERKNEGGRSLIKRKKEGMRRKNGKEGRNKNTKERKKEYVSNWFCTSSL